MSARKEILFDGYFYDVTDFISKHPGGTVIEYYTEKGEDSTHAIQQFHKRFSDKVKVMMSALKQRPATDREIGLDAEVLKRNRSLTEDFTKLHLELEREGYFKPSYVQAFVRVMEIFLLIGVGLFLTWSENVIISCIGFIVFGVGHARCAYLMHEMGHYSLSGNPSTEKIMSSLFYGVILGLSASRWRRQHNRHHAMPQRLNRDIDLDTMPLLAFNAKAVKNSEDGKGFMIQNQALLFFIDTFIIVSFWKLYQDPKFILKRKVTLEIVALIGHWFYLYYNGFRYTLFVLWFSSLFVIGNLSLGHTFLPVTTKPTHWVEYSLLHTANVEHAPWCDWVMGYFNYQIEHHFFPTIPNFRLPFIKDRVRALAEKHNIPYVVHSYPEAWRKMFANLRQVAKEVKEKS